MAETEDWNESDAALMEDIIAKIVDYPNEVKVEERGLDTMTSLFVIRVRPEDRGKVIGRNGSTIEALRKIFAVIKAVGKRKAVLEVAGQESRDTYKRR
jgi:hypothetical protein